MPTIKNCICAIPLGTDPCETTTGIAELYYCHYKQIKDIIFAPTTLTPGSPACCLEGEFASFALDVTVPTALPEELLQPLEFVQQDDDSGALVEWTWSDEGGNKVRNYTATIQAITNTPDQECAIDKAIGKQLCLVFKGKDGFWRILNWDGGAKLLSSAGNTNQSYTVLVLSGRVNSRMLYVSYTDSNAWSDANLVPVSVNPSGLINA